MARKKPFFKKADPDFPSGGYGWAGMNAKKFASSDSLESAIFIGPEKGFSEKEVGILEHLGVKSIRLHENILRVETAALVGLVFLGL